MSPHLGHNGSIVVRKHEKRADSREMGSWQLSQSVLDDTRVGDRAVVLQTGAHNHQELTVGRGWEEGSGQKVAN